MTAVARARRTTERERDAERKRLSRARERIVVIPPCANKRRRKRLEKDIFAWLRWYGASEFTRDFTDCQKEMIMAILNAIKHGGDQSIAAPRGEGKSSVAEWVLVFCVLTGLVKFGVLFAATGSDAEASLDSIRERFEDERYDRLADDYPEVCTPVRALENTPQRAGTQIVSGHRYDNGKPFASHPSRFSWCGREIHFPRVPGSPASGAIIATRGLDAAVRGMKRGSVRPQIAVIDDPDTEETVNSEEQAAKLERKIDRAIAGLAGQDRRLSRVMLTTVQRRGTVSDRYTDPTAKPSFRGKRFKFLVVPPERVDLWEEYIGLRHGDLQNGTTHAHDFYVANRDAMDAGAVVSNPYRRGDAGELSALQFYFNEVARVGQEAVDTELQNDPPEESGPIESGITPYRIQRQLSGFDRRVIPDGCTVLTQGIDVQKVALHWTVRAWRTDGAGFYTIDYGVHEVYGTKYNSDEGLDIAIKRAIIARMEAFAATEYLTESGERISDPLTLVDAGWRTQAVYSACVEIGLGVLPVMGFGKSTGSVQTNFHDVLRNSPDKKPGDGWFLSKKGTPQTGKLWLVCADADRWKAWEHDRWMTAPQSPGCMYLFGQGSGTDRMNFDERSHHSYAHHICNEVEVEEPYKGGIRRIWKAKGPNHYLDASYYASVAANMRGIRLFAPANAPTADRRKVSIPAHMKR